MPEIQNPDFLEKSSLSPSRIIYNCYMYFSINQTFPNTKAQGLIAGQRARFSRYTLPLDTSFLANAD